MTDEEKRELDVERRNELLEDDRDMPDICADCGEVLDEEYFEYEYYGLKGDLHAELYCPDCFESVLKDLKTQARRSTKD